MSMRWIFNSTAWQPSKDNWVLAAQCIQKEEKERIGKFVFKRDAKSSMIGRLMLRKVIKDITDIPYTEIKLGRTEKGKPYLQNDLPLSLKTLSFNVSHQGDLVVLAAEKNSTVGIDVMKLDTPRSSSIPEFFHTMRRQFTEDEWRSIKSSNVEKEQLKVFYRLWCLKESYVKALGTGIGFEVQRLNFDLKTKLLSDCDMITTTTLKVDGSPASDWVFQEAFREDHCIAVAVNQKEIGDQSAEVPDFIKLSFTDLMEGAKPLSDPDIEYVEKFLSKDEDPFVKNQTIQR